LRSLPPCYLLKIYIGLATYPAIPGKNETMEQFWIQVGLVLLATVIATVTAVFLVRSFFTKSSSQKNLEKTDISLDTVTFEKKIRAGLKKRIDRLRRLEEEIEVRKEEVDRLKESYEQKLISATGLSKEQVLEELKESLNEESQSALDAYRHELLEQPMKELERQSKSTLLAVMQRIGSNPMTEETATTVAIPSEEMKGRLIGREGRNIRSFESVTGTSLLIDETPDTVLISAFDPVRREVARATLEALIQDGRIHPASIEEKYQEALGEIDKGIIERGEEALRKLRISNIHPEIVQLLGKLHFCHSYSQNSLEHSVEVGFIASLLASEIGLDANLAKRAGLLHDLGKAISHEYEGSHANAAAKILRHHGESPTVVNAVEASHEEVPAESPYAGLIHLADSLSASRPGARADSTEGYIQRVRSLESIGKGFTGVKDCYALQAGREIRIIVDPEDMDDTAARDIALKIRTRIENELNYPSTIKITVIRESRFSEVAK